MNMVEILSIVKQIVIVNFGQNEMVESNAPSQGLLDKYTKVGHFLT